MRTIYYHGEVVTMEKENQYAEAFCVADGIIEAVGTDEDILNRRQEGDRLVNLTGKTVFPGFVDGHSHFAGVANALTQCDLREVSSFEELIIMMKEFIKRKDIPQGEWVCGNSYDHNFLLEHRHPDKDILDKISTVHPIMVIHASSHMGSVNSLALKILQIDERTSDPADGKYYRIKNSRKPNGHMEETAFIAAQKKIPLLDIEAFMKLLVKAQDIYAGYGITTVQEGLMDTSLFQLLSDAASRQLLYLDIIGYVDVRNSRNIWIENKPLTKQYRNHFKIGGYKIFLDGSPQGRTAWLTKPYEGEETYCGYPSLCNEDLYKLIETSFIDEAQLLAHCNGDATSEQFVSQFEKARKQYPNKKPKRPVMIHAQLVQTEQLKRMSALCMLPSFFIAHTYYWGDVHIKNLGFQRASRISPAKTAEQFHIPYTFHQDSPVIQPDMMKTVWCAVNRKTRNGVSIGEEEKVTVWEAMKAITINGAYQYSEEMKKGTITPGKAADIVILDKNPLRMESDRIKDIIVLETMKDGKTIYRKN